jgi:hypothetical protein
MKDKLFLHKLLIHNHKEWTITIHGNIDESQSSFAKWKKADKRNIYCIVLFILLSQNWKAKVTGIRLETAWESTGIKE